MARSARFVSTLQVRRAVRVRTSSTNVQFVDPEGGIARQNDFGGKVIDIPPGALLHVVCVTEKPDQATMILELKNGKRSTRAGLVLRQLGWDEVQAASDAAEVAPAEEAQDDVARMTAQLEARMPGGTPLPEVEKKPVGRPRKALPAK